ncbi:alpha/beta fold hydrolase [Ferruginibacter albus]|uniref:alpha/beta fold hydrolase n=1 Tax=Ferruginibacter albus TaxID=2875540 RepID=UPI001CC63550|nr:alpha/beta hydrolase [Ferruginibacter albus]UAY51450.1 alpha/beta hydrolase [Ferruginibacter albus]
MKKVYFISGVGASKKLFNFLDLSFCDPHFIEWIPPFKKESLQQYALRLKALMPENDPVIVGVSLGGMLASEIARAYPLSKVIIISSNKTSAEFPAYLRIGKHIPVYKLFPDNFFTKRSFILKYFFNSKGTEEQKLHKIILQETDVPFTKWAIGAILKWKTNNPPSNITHIHGTADTLLPYYKVKADYTIKGGTHIMTLDRAKEISALLKKLL